MSMTRGGDGLDLYRVDGWEAFGVRAFVTGRAGGVSPEPFDTLNTAASVGDGEANVAENLRRIAAAVGVERIFLPSQVHGDAVAVIDERAAAHSALAVPADAVVTPAQPVDDGGGKGALSGAAAHSALAVPADAVVTPAQPVDEGGGKGALSGAAAHSALAVPADAIVTALPGIAVGVRTADCLPILIADPEGRAVAAIHAGRASTELRIVEKTVTLMADRYGVDPARLHAFLGPCIRRCCYEVDAASAQRFASCCGEGSADGRMVDLIAANRLQLAAAGVDPGRIVDSGICTACEPERFYSYRRGGGTTGRFVSGAFVI